MNKEEIMKEIEHIANCELYDTIGVKYLRLNIEKLFEENKQLKDNWNELKKWLEENESFDDYCNETTFTSVLDKMQELEQESGV